VLRVVLEVSVLNDCDVAVRVRDGSTNRRALAAIPLPDEDDAVTTVLPLLDEIAGSVSRTVVDDDDLLFEVECPHPVEHCDDSRRLVEGGDEERDAHARTLCRSCHGPEGEAEGQRNRLDDTQDGN